METVVYGPSNTVIDDVVGKIKNAQQQLEIMRAQVTQLMSDTSDVQIGQIANNAKTISEKNQQQFKALLPFRGAQFECLEKIETEGGNVVRQLEIQLQNTMNKLYQFSLGKQYVDQQIKTPKVPKTPELKEIQFPGNLQQTQELYGVKSYMADSPALAMSSFRQ